MKEFKVSQKSNKETLYTSWKEMQLNFHIHFKLEKRSEQMNKIVCMNELTSLMCQTQQREILCIYTEAISLGEWIIKEQIYVLKIYYQNIEYNPKTSS